MDSREGSNEATGSTNSGEFIGQQNNVSFLSEILTLRACLAYFHRGCHVEWNLETLKYF